MIHLPFEYQLIIYLIRKYSKIMLACEIDQLFQRLLVVDASCRVVWVYDNDGFGLFIDVLLDVTYVKVPVLIFVQRIELLPDAVEIEISAVDRIRWPWYQHVVARIEESGDAHSYRLGDAKAYEYIAVQDAADTLSPVKVGYRVYRLLLSGRISVIILVLEHRLVDCLYQVRRSFEIKAVRIADVEKNNFLFLGDLLCKDGYVPDRVFDVLRPFRRFHDYTFNGKNLS